MTPVPRLESMILIPAQRQRPWGWPAVVNFSAGGLGAGFYAVAVMAAVFQPSPALTLASWLSPALVMAGFAAVAVEAGRPGRGPRVLLRVGRSWMSREAWAGGLFVVLALGEFIGGGAGRRLLAALAGVAFVLAQGWLLRRARGVPAWDVSLTPLVFLASAAIAGLGLYTVVELARGDALRPALLSTVLVVLLLGAMVWVAYLEHSNDAVFMAATRPLRAGPMAVTLIGAGYVVPVGLAALAATFPGTAPAAVAVAAGLMVLGQIQAKAALVLSAGQLRPITLALRPLGGRLS